MGVEASRDARDLVTMATVLFLAMCVLTTTAWGVTRTGLLAARGLRLKPPARPTGPIVPDSLTSWVKLFLALTAASFLALMGAISWEAGETFKSFLTTTFLVSAGASGFAALGWTLRKLGLVS